MAKEGLPILAIVLGFTLIAYIISIKTTGAASAIFLAVACFCAVFTIFSAYFFRDPERTVPQGKDIIVSAADGKVVQIIETDCEFLGGKARQISIFLNVFNVHVNRIPEKGTVEYYKYYPGKFLAAWDHKASLDNEQTHVGLNCGTYKILVKQIAGLIARRIVCRARDGMAYGRGDRFGLIRFGSRTDVIIPLDFTVKVKIGDKVQGASTILAVREQQ